VGPVWLILYSKWDDSNSNSKSEPVEHSNNVLKKFTSTQTILLVLQTQRIITKEKDQQIAGFTDFIQFPPTTTTNSNQKRKILRLLYKQVVATSYVIALPISQIR
jgi:hypothetical protein